MDKDLIKSIPILEIFAIYMGIDPNSGVNET